MDTVDQLLKGSLRQSLWKCLLRCTPLHLVRVVGIPSLEILIFHTSFGRYVSIFFYMGVTMGVMRGEIRHWFWMFLASGEIRHWQFMPLDEKPVSAQRSVFPSLACARQDPILLKSIQMIANGLVTLRRKFSQLRYRGMAGPLLIGIISQGHENELPTAWAYV